MARKIIHCCLSEVQTMAELKPCPFCGGKAFIDHFMQPNDEWRIKCMDCPARFGRYAGLNKKEAIEAWNRRAENEEIKFTRQFIHDHGLEFALASAWNRRAEDGKV